MKTLATTFSGLAHHRLVSTKTATALISLDCLRPGDWLFDHRDDRKWCVLINSERHLRMVLFSDTLGYEGPMTYAEIAFANLHHAGRGKRRWWWHLLPRYFRDITCQYSKP